MLKSLQRADPEIMCAPHCLEVHFASQVFEFAKIKNEGDGRDIRIEKDNNNNNNNNNNNEDEDELMKWKWRKSLVEEYDSEGHGIVYITADSKDKMKEWESALSQFLL